MQAQAVGISSDEREINKITQGFNASVADCIPQGTFNNSCFITLNLKLTV